MRLTSRERVEGAIHLLGDGEVLRADVQGPCTLDLRLGGEIPRWRSTVARSCSNSCSNTADFADVRECSPVSRSLVALRIRSLANGSEHAAQDWGSRGRRFKSCHPDGKQQVRGRFGQNPRRPLCFRVAIGVATVHILTSPFAAESSQMAKRAPWLARWPCTSPATATGECPSSSETVCSARRDDDRQMFGDRSPILSRDRVEKPGEV